MKSGTAPSRTSPQSPDASNAPVFSDAINEAPEIFLSGMDNAHALVIGIADYWHPNRYFGKLPPAVCQDAQDVYALLVDPQRGGYRAEQVQLLLDDQATLAGLRRGLADLAARCDAESVVFLYLSSHGGHIPAGPDAGEYLLPVDVIYTDDGHLRPETALSGAEFSAALAAIPARKVLVIFDCCHAGGIGEIKGGAAPEMKAGLPESYYEALKAGRGRVILAASRSTESSWLMPGDANSLFTVHLLAGLAGGVVSPDGFVRVFDLFEYVQPRVTGAQPQQHPVFQSRMEENFPVALSLGGQKDSVPITADGYRYDAYVVYAEQNVRDADWVWRDLIPSLEAAGLRVAVSDDVLDPGVARVASIRRGLEQARRTVVVLSQAFLNDTMATFESILSLTMGIEQNAWRLLPVIIEPFDESRLPAIFGRTMARPVNLVNPRRPEYGLPKVIDTLKAPPQPIILR